MCWIAEPHGTRLQRTACDVDVPLLNLIHRFFNQSTAVSVLPVEDQFECTLQYALTLEKICDRLKDHCSIFTTMHAVSIKQKNG